MRNVTYYLLRLIQEINYYTSCILEKRHQYVNSIEIRHEDIVRLTKNVGFSHGIDVNRKYSAGKTIIFDTDATEININVLYRKHAIMPHMSVRGTSGIDIYVKEHGYIWKKCVSPDTSVQMRLAECVSLSDEYKNKTVVMYLPPYAAISKLCVSCAEHCYINRIMSNSNKKIVIYGSSISQGCAASRPGMSFANILHRKLDVTCLNYGFSESAKGQLDIIRQMIDETPNLYIIEYDHNASVVELQNTHLNVYLTIRKSDAQTPIVFMSRFSGEISICEEEEMVRITIISKTIEYAKQHGDFNTYFINGKNALVDKEDCFTDDRHPNDYGMMQIAKLILGEDVYID